MAPTRLLVATGAPWFPGSPSSQPLPFDHARALCQDRPATVEVRYPLCQAEKKPVGTEKGGYVAVTGTKSGATAAAGPFMLPSLSGASAMYPHRPEVGEADGCAEHREISSTAHSVSGPGIKFPAVRHLPPLRRFTEGPSVVLRMPKGSAPER